MFNPLRLLRRQEHIDESAEAYIEGRATRRDRAELGARAAQEPGLFEDLDTMRQTVSLLRTVAPARAPRSFALVEAPVQVRVRRSRLAMAPAVFAIAAAAAVGLLAAGDLANIVNQGGADESALSFSSGGSAADAVRTSEIESASSAGASGGAADAGFGFESITSENSDGATESAAAVAPETAPLPTSDPTPGFDLDALEPASEDTALTPPATEPDDTLVTSDDILVEEIERADASLDSAITEDGETQAERGEPAGINLPIWQLQIAFALFAVVMASAWFVLQRRSVS